MIDRLIDFQFCQHKMVFDKKKYILPQTPVNLLFSILKTKFRFINASDLLGCRLSIEFSFIINRSLILICFILPLKQTQFVEKGFYSLHLVGVGGLINCRLFNIFGKYLYYMKF